MRVIKLQDQNQVALQKMSFSADAPARSQAVPAWMEAAAAQVRLPGQKSAADAARLEKAAYERGVREAERAAGENADKKIEVVMKRYADGIQEIGRLKQVLYARAEHEVVRLALEVAKKIVHREVRVDQEIIQTLIRVALSHVAAKSPVTVHLNPVDYNFLRERQGDADQTGFGNRELALVSDRSVDRGGCLIESECGEVDARIEEEFREVERAFFGEGRES